MSTFEQLGLSSETLQAIYKLGFEEPTPIQEKAIPLALAGADVIGQAPTGTGKTAAFGLPIIEGASTNQEHIQGLVVVPTRELAIQVAEELNKIGEYKRVHTLPIYGGQDMMRQIKLLKKRPQIVVGTPGRLMDHMRRRTIRLQNISIVVLDEADEMLNMGFVDDIQYILGDMPAERQTLLFSASITKAVESIAKQFMQEPTMIQATPRNITVPSTEQHYIEVPERKKFDILCNLLDLHSPEAAIIFGRTKKRVDELNQALSRRGYSTGAIHGDLNQSQRNAVMSQFRSGSIDILVATDVAARGLDIEGVSHVYNYDIPQDPESYIHRIGRTGRAGRKGVAFTFITHRELDHLRIIENLTKRKIIRHPMPTLTDALAGQQQVTIERVLKTVEESALSAYRGMAESLLEHHDSVTLLAATLKLLTKEPSTTPVQITEDNYVLPRAKKERTPGPQRTPRRPRRSHNKSQNKSHNKPRHKSHD
ncbi:MAG: DEAD/DEAH box helicase [Firmicutes bacterium]|nr:DEAD/DEAH box helicase [Bacillota bacterium]